VVNQTGEHEFAANTFFYVANANTAPQNLIAPPTFLYDRLEGSRARAATGRVERYRRLGHAKSVERGDRRARHEHSLDRHASRDSERPGRRYRCPVAARARLAFEPVVEEGRRRDEVLRRRVGVRNVEERVGGELVLASLVHHSMRPSVTPP